MPGLAARDHGAHLDAGRAEDTPAPVEFMLRSDDHQSIDIVMLRKRARCTDDDGQALDLKVDLIYGLSHPDAVSGTKDHGGCGVQRQQLLGDRLWGTSDRADRPHPRHSLIAIDVDGTLIANGL